MAEFEGRWYFPAVSDERTLADDRDLTSVSAGGRVLWSELLYAATDDTYGRGPQIGTVDLNHLRMTTGNRIWAEALFTFVDDEGVEYATAHYEGWVPGGDSWQGKSWFEFVSGSPRDDGSPWPPRIRVESENPKRWGT